MDTRRFRIHHLSNEEIEEIVKRYKKALTDIVGDKVFAYRAGGGLCNLLTGWHLC